MCRFRIAAAVVMLGFMVPGAHAQQAGVTLDQAIDKIVSQEQAEMKMLHEYSPLVETYIQGLSEDKENGLAPNGDVYFLGRAQFQERLTLVPFTDGDAGRKGKDKGKDKANDKGDDKAAKASDKDRGKSPVKAADFAPQDFLQMIQIDPNGFDRQHYDFDLVQRESLGDVRCLVFDVTPQAKGGKGRFIGRIWVEDQDFRIVRFNGSFADSAKSGRTVHFDSWRVNAGQNQWFPALIYTEANDDRNAIAKRLVFKGQTRLWGYSLVPVKRTQELGKILPEPDAQAEHAASSTDLSPLEAQRTWNRQAEDNVLDRMERQGLLAPRGEVDKVLDTVINNLEVTNNLDVEIRSRVLMTSTLEAFTVGHTIVMSRGLIDVLPDEASLAVMLARELSHVVLGHRVDTEYSFFDQLLFDDKDTFRHWGFARTPEEEKAAMDKAVELLNKSPYKGQLEVAQRFLHALESRSKEIPNLISPNLGDEVPTGWEVAATAPAGKASGSIIALPLGGRIKLDPWNNHLTMLKAKPLGAVAEREEMPFEVTPFILNLTRQNSAPGNKSASRQTP